MEMSRFDIPFRSNVECLEHAVRNSKHLTMMHAALLKAAFDEAEALDSLRLGRDPESGGMLLSRMHNTYKDILKMLGLSYEQVVASAPAKDGEQGDAASAPAAPVMSLAKFRKTAASEA